MEIENGAVEIFRSGTSAGAFVTCEHASEEFPAPWSLSEEDAWLAGTHWAYDIGAYELARDVCRTLDTTAVLARFSRLLADPNRPRDSFDLFRKTAEGRAIALNRCIEDDERERRLGLWEAYHRAADREIERSPAKILLAVHTFTPTYEGALREMDVGVLFDEEESLAEHFARALSRAGFRVAMNEPYSGKQGLMYSVDRHARRHGRRAIELEVRQDLAVLADVRWRVARATADVLGGPA